MKWCPLCYEELSIRKYDTMAGTYIHYAHRTDLYSLAPGFNLKDGTVDSGLRCWTGSRDSNQIWDYWNNRYTKYADYWATRNI